MGRHASRLESVPHVVHGDMKLIRFRRSPDDLRWEADLKLPAPIGRKQVGLGTTDLDEAQHRASAVRADLLAKAHAGLKITTRKASVRIMPDYTRPEAAPPGTPTFRDAAVIAVAELRADMAAEAKRFPAHVAGRTQKFRQLINRIERILLPWFGDRALSTMRRSDINDFKREYRTVKGTKPAKNTVGNVAHALGKVMAIAEEKGWISSEHQLRLSHANVKKGDRRPSFTDAEFKQLLDRCFDGWIDAGGREVIRQSRLLLSAYIRLVACTGIRPGIEVETLRRENVNNEIGSAGQKFGLIKVIHGKTGKIREAIIRNMPGCDWVDTILALYSIQETGTHLRSYKMRDFLFARPMDGKIPSYATLFGQLLDYAGLRIDRETEQPRTLYSLRHFYATHSLQHGVPDHWLARQMGTSIHMIHEHYSHANTRDAVDLLLGPPISALPGA